MRENTKNENEDEKDEKEEEKNQERWKVDKIQLEYKN